jgi:hypothetical protein
VDAPTAETEDRSLPTRSASDIGRQPSGPTTVREDRPLSAYGDIPFGFRIFLAGAALASAVLPAWLGATLLTASALGCVLAPPTLTGAWKFGGHGNRPNAGFAAFCCALVAAFVWGHDFPELYWRDLLVRAAIFGVIYALIAVLVARARGVIPIGMATITGFLCGWAFLSEINIHLDRNEGHSAPVVILHRSVSHGRGYTIYSFEVAPIGAPGSSQPSWEDVSSQLFHSVKKGDAVCRVDRPGAIGIRWVRLELCR